MSPDADCYAAYRGRVLLFAFVAGGGPILGPISDAAPLYTHAAIRGRLLVAGASEPLGALVEKEKTIEATIEALRSAGYDVHPTTREALRWALSGI